MQHGTGSTPLLGDTVGQNLDGVTLPRGEAGELRTRGYGVMPGCRGEPDRTAEVIGAGRWMHTGDLALIREDGCVQIAGRIKDMIIRGGENVCPREVEEFLYGHPKTSDVRMAGVPDDRYGEEIPACVVPRDRDGPPTPDGITAYCRDRPAHCKVPRRLRIRESFPVTVGGKVGEVDLRERYAE